MIAPGNWSQPALPGNAFAAIQTTAAITVSSRIRNLIQPRSQHSEGDGASAFVTDPAGSSQDQAIFWAPEVLPTIIPIVQSTAASNGNALGLAEMSAGEFRQASDGWHVLLRIHGLEHRLWLREPLLVGSSYAAELPLDVCDDEVYRIRLVRLGFGTAVVEDTMLVTKSGVEALSGQPTARYL